MGEIAREIDRAAAMATRGAAREARAAVRQRLRNVMTEVDALARSLREAADFQVRDRPWQMIGVALATGVAIGVLLTRGTRSNRAGTSPLQ